jgi:hypothetical protein
MPDLTQTFFDVITFRRQAKTGIVCSSWGMWRRRKQIRGWPAPDLRPSPRPVRDRAETPVVIVVRRRAGFVCLLT